MKDKEGNNIEVVCYAKPRKRTAKLPGTAIVVAGVTRSASPAGSAF